MKSEFIIERHGKKYVLYQGLLDEAHARGLRSIEVELLQMPSADNGFTAISKATVRMAVEEGGSKIFTDIGDASPGNVTKTIEAHIIRMSSTRAKARALRDAINIGVTAYEELGVDEEPSPLPQQKNTTQKNNSAKEKEALSEEQLTERQYEDLIALSDQLYEGRDKNLSGHEWLQREIGRSFVELSAREADKLIEKLTERKEQVSVVEA